MQIFLKKNKKIMHADLYKHRLKLLTMKIHLSK